MEDTRRYRLTKDRTNRQLPEGTIVARTGRVIPRTRYVPALHYVRVVDSGQLLTEPWIGFGVDEVPPPPPAFKVGSRVLLAEKRGAGALATVIAPLPVMPIGWVWMQFPDGSVMAADPSRVQRPMVPMPEA